MRYETTVYRRDGGEHRYVYEDGPVVVTLASGWLVLRGDEFTLTLRQRDVSGVETLPFGEDDAPDGGAAAGDEAPDAVSRFERAG